MLCFSVSVGAMGGVKPGVPKEKRNPEEWNIAPV